MRKTWFLLLFVLLIPTMILAQDSTQVLNLKDCIRLALQNNYELNLAQINNRIAAKNHTQSYSNILPRLNISYGSSKYERGPSSYLGNDYIGVVPALPFTYQITTGRNYSGQLQITQNIFDGGRWYLNIKKSKWDKLASQYSYLSTRQKIIVTVRQLYMDLLKQEKLLEVKKKAVERSQQQLERVKSMYQVGSVAQIDVYRSEVNLGSDRIELLNQRNALLQARQSLNLALGREPETPIEIDSTVQFRKKVEELPRLIQKALQNNPELKIYQTNILSSRYGVKLAKSAFLPNLSGFFSYSRRVPRFEGIYQDLDREYSWYLGINVSWNLFNGFSDYLNVQKARLNKRYAEQQYQYQRLSLKSTVSNLYNNLQALNEIITINQTNLASAREDYRLAQERYRLGSGTLLDLRDAQVKLANAEQILVAAEFNAYITYAELQQALGELVGNGADEGAGR